MFREAEFDRKVLLKDLQLKEAGIESANVKLPIGPSKLKASRLEAELVFSLCEANTEISLDESSGLDRRRQLNT